MKVIMPNLSRKMCNLPERKFSTPVIVVFLLVLFCKSRRKMHLVLLSNFEHLSRADAYFRMKEMLSKPLRTPYGANTNNRLCLNSLMPLRKSKEDKEVTEGRYNNDTKLQRNHLFLNVIIKEVFALFNIFLFSNNEVFQNFHKLYENSILVTRVIWLINYI